MISPPAQRSPRSRFAGRMCCLFCVKAVPRDLLLCANTAEMLVHKLRSGTPGGTHAQASKTRKIQIQLVCFERHPEKVRRRPRQSQNSPRQGDERTQKGGDHPGENESQKAGWKQGLFAPEGALAVHRRDEAQTGGEASGSRRRRRGR